MKNLLDTQHTIATPEGIDLTVRPAGPLARGLALSLDIIFEGLITLAIATVFLTFGEFGQGLVLMTFFMLNWFYSVLFEVYNQGMTPGKKILGIRVIHNDGTPIGWSASVIRNLLRFADSFPGFYLTGLITMLLTEHYCRLGDLAAGSLVVYNREHVAKPKIPELTPENPPFAFNLEEQRAILSFAERNSDLSQSRSKELAEILSPVIPATDTTIVEKLYQIARGLMGK